MAGEAGVAEGGGEAVAEAEPQNPETLKPRL